MAGHDLYRDRILQSGSGDFRCAANPPAASEESTEAVAVHFRTAIKREYTEVYVIDRFVLQLLIKDLRILAAFARRMHVGHVNAYAAYVLLAMLLVLIVGLRLF